MVFSPADTEGHKLAIDLDFLKTFRETADWLLNFPRNLVTAALAVPDFLLERRVRIEKLKEIIEIRELCKIVQNFSWSKDNLVIETRNIIGRNDRADAEHLRSLIDDVRNNLDQLLDYILHSNLRDIALVTEAIRKIAEAKNQYNMLEPLTDEYLVSNDSMIILAEFAQQAAHDQKHLIEQLDQARHFLDHVY